MRADGRTSLSLERPRVGRARGASGDPNANEARTNARMDGLVYIDASRRRRSSSCDDDDDDGPHARTHTHDTRARSVVHGDVDSRTHANARTHRSRV